MEALNKLKEISSQSADFVKTKVGKSANRITEWLRKFDRRIRINDHSYNYTYRDRKPLLSKVDGRYVIDWKALLLLIKAEGHYFFISWTVLLLSSFLILGPNLDSIHGYAPAILLVVSYAAAILIPLKLAKPNNLLFYQAGLLAMLSLLIWFWLSKGHVERDGEPYRHILFAGFVLMLLGILLSKKIASWLLGKYKSPPFAERIKEVELFYSTVKHPMDVSWLAYIRSFLTTPFYNPIKLLLFPSMFVLLMPDRYLMWWGICIVGSVVWLYFAAANVHERLHYLAEVLDGLFFKGGQLVVSVVVIALAIARVFDESHVTTLIESSPGRVNMTLIRYVLAAYILFWFFEYWINRYLLESFVKLFSTANNKNEPCKITFDANKSKTDVAAAGRTLQAHGGSRLIVLGNHSVTAEQCWHTYSRRSLLDKIFSQLDIDDEDINKDYQTAQVIKQRMRVFFLLLNLYLVFSIGILTWHYMDLPQKAEASSVQLTVDEHNNLFNLHGHIFPNMKNEPNKEQEPDQPLIFIAASGGGTRAALYAESLLRGLREYDLLDNVVLTSSVSGGSAAMAYFAAYREQLLNDEVKDEEGNRWQTFSEVMGEPFIQDVLEGIVDWRIIGGVKQQTEEGKNYKAGFRLGELLAESFENRFGLIEQSEQGKKLRENNRIGFQKHFGAIFNTAIVAKFPRWNCTEVEKNEDWKKCVCKTQKPLAQREDECSDLRTSIGKGGRLIFTNLQNSKAFPHSGQPVTDDEYLTYEVLQDPKIPLTRAAALSANFPPIFPNAAVDVENVRRYWVTDGGVSDNRGVLSLLYALRDALQQEKERCKDKDTDCSKATRPDLHVFIAEASATTLSFSRSIGISAAFGAPAQFASQLMVGMADEVKRIYEEDLKTVNEEGKVVKGKVYFHYLAMPLMIRSNGGLGTHWMLPTTVKFNQPLNIGLQGKYNEVDPIKLSGDEARQLVDALHSKQEPLLDNYDMNTLWQWICKDQYSRHQQVWLGAITQLRPDIKIEDIDKCAAR